MDVIVFKSDVRARDPNLRWLNDKCRQNLNDDEVDAVADMVMEHCTFVDDWKNVPENAVRIVSTRAAEQTVMEEFLSGRITREYSALDEGPEQHHMDPCCCSHFE